MLLWFRSNYIIHEEWSKCHLVWVANSEITEANIKTFDCHETFTDKSWSAVLCSQWENAKALSLSTLRGKPKRCKHFCWPMPMSLMPLKINQNCSSSQLTLKCWCRTPLHVQYVDFILSIQWEKRQTVGKLSQTFHISLSLILLF